MSDRHSAPEDVETSFDPDAIGALISPARFEEFLGATAEDPGAALRLYQWSAQMSAALFELIGHAEVLLRNAIDRALAVELQETERRIPWFMMPLPNVTSSIRNEALAYSDFTTDRDSALASLTLGYWKTLVDRKQMWEYIEPAFVADAGRAQVQQRVTMLHELRNRLAHHGSVLEVDVPAHVANALELVGLIEPQAKIWLSRVERATALYAELPIDIPDTVLVPAGRAWPAYGRISAYVCQAGRPFRPVRRLAFYSDGQINTSIPKIVAHLDHVPWAEEHAARLAVSRKNADKHLAKVIRATRSLGWVELEHQVFLLTSGQEKGHVELTAPIKHDKTGRGSAFVHKQRYFHLSDLLQATVTSDLPKSYFLTDPPLMDTAVAEGIGDDTVE